MSAGGSQAPTAPAALDVVLVAGTRVRLRQLGALLADPGFRVGGAAQTPIEALTMVERHRPDVVLLDLDLDDGGLEAVERIMAGRATPIVVCGPAAQRPEAALAAGAVDVVGALDVPPSSPAYASAVRRHLAVASRVRVITHPRARLRARALPAAPTGLVRLVAIGASTGGPPALATILADLPEDLEVPVLVVQHMADGFIEGLGRWLDDLSPLPVVVVEDGTRLAAGRVHLAPAGRNLVVRSGTRVELVEPPTGQFHVPAIDVTLSSVAAACGSRAVGVLLTGMGRDGAAGLQAMRQAGAFTIGQDEPTSVVWGMPAAARALDAVDIELPLSAISDALVCAVRGAASDAGPTTVTPVAAPAAGWST